MDEKIQLSAAKTRRDYHLSLVLLVAGIVDVVSFYAYASWANSTGNYPTAVAIGVTISAIGEAGYVLILVGAIFAGVNWSLLRKSRRNA
ncbi:MAG: hypothetical protein WB984_02785 [Thermoplasmata archaeon]